MARRDDNPPTQRRSPGRSAKKGLELREQETRRELNEFVKFLIDAAEDGVHDKEAKRTREERARLSIHKHLIANSVAELIKDLTDHHDARVRERRLQNLWQALGSSALIASQQVTNPIAERLTRQSAAHATAKKKETSAKIDDVIIATAGPIWHKHPKWTPWRVAGTSYEQVSDQLPKRLGQNAVAKRLGHLRKRIFSAN